MKFFTTVVAMLFALQSFAFVKATTATSTFIQTEGIEGLSELPGAATNLKINEFLDLTPNKYKEMTGEKLGFKKTLQLKAAQKVIKKKLRKESGSDIPKGLYIVGIILGWGWLLMGLMDDFSGNNWWVNLILTALCWLPGVIHGFIKMKDYY